MRLIDADAVSNKLEEIASEPDYQHEGEDWMTGVIIAQTEVDFAPTIDAVPVVRCKDCKYKNFDGIGGLWCGRHSMYIDDVEGFCSYGERKDGDGNG